MSERVTNESTEMIMKTTVKLEGDLNKIFFLKFKDIQMVNAGPDIKPGSKAATCRYLNGNMYNIQGDMYKLQIYFKRPINANSTDIADEVEKFFKRT